MISFKQFISESQEFDLEKFKTDCAFMLSQLKGNKGRDLLFHGTTDGPKGEWEIRTFRERQKPRDSDDYMHAQVNKMFTDMFGAPARNWLFTTGRSDDARIYGKTLEGVLVIFPIGEFEWLCGLDEDLQDLTGWHTRVSGQLMSVAKDLSYDERQIQATNHMVSRMRHMHWLHNERLVECIRSDHEIHVKCNKFYAFKMLEPTFTDIIHPFLKTL